MPVYTSGKPPVSSIIRNTFLSRLSATHGFRAIDPSNKGDFAAKYGMEFVRVDLDNAAYKVKNAALGSVFSSRKLSSNLERYFDAYVNETLFSYSDIQDRQKRCVELFHYYCNSDIGKVVVDLTADESTQLDVQNRIISVDSPNLLFTNKVYELLNLWGFTQTRIREFCWNLELYGETFWANKVGINGIEKITPIDVNIINEVLEFSPMKMAQYIAQRDGYLSADKNRGSKIEKLMKMLRSPEASDISDNLADLFDDKLLGYELQDGTVCPPWNISHARLECREFFPYGRPPLLACLSAYKLETSAIMLEGLARQMSFPVTLYKVKGSNGFGPEIQFEHVNTVREEYDNLGVSIDSAGGEVYTVNTKMWLPDDLVTVEVVKNDTDFKFVDDIKLYRDKGCIAGLVPKNYFDPSSEGFQMSGIALMEQFKPFARHVFEIQSAFLQALGELIRLHFAITGEFDYNTPFLLSMRFPAEEMSDEKRNARSASLDLSKSIIDLITQSLGLEEGEPLPEDIITDILSKYSFLDPTDIQKWIRLGSFLAPVSSEGNEDGGSGAGGDLDLGGGDMDLGGGDAGGDLDLDLGGDDAGGDLDLGDGGSDGGAPAEEARKLTQAQQKRLLRERVARKKYLEAKRLKELKEKYNDVKETIRFQFLESNHITGNIESKGYGNDNLHQYIVPKINKNNNKFETFEVLRNNKTDGLKKLKESYATSVADIMMEIQKQSIGTDELERDQKVDDAINEILL